jgi:mercuric reductase
MEMVFLKDDAAASAWHGGDLQHHSVFTLDEAVEFGARFFNPLLG